MLSYFLEDANRIFCDEYLAGSKIGINGLLQAIQIGWKIRLDLFLQLLEYALFCLPRFSSESTPSHAWKSPGH